MNRTVQPLNVAIWLHLMREGGFSSVAELRACGLDLGENPHRRMEDMRKNGSLARAPDGSAKYGVTTTCKLPNGITLKQVLEATR